MLLPLEQHHAIKCMLDSMLTKRHSSKFHYILYSYSRKNVDIILLDFAFGIRSILEHCIWICYAEHRIKKFYVCTQIFVRIFNAERTVSWAINVSWVIKYSNGAESDWDFLLG
jgi:hypothetical protein